jgi:hypothetical protein
VGGEDRPELQSLDHLGQPRLAGGGADPGHRGGHRAGDGRVGRVALAQRADAVVLLGQVGEVEVDGERPRDLAGALQCPALDEGRDLGAVDLAAAGGDDGVPEPFDVVQEFLAAVLHEAVAEHRTEQPDVAAQRFGHVLPESVACVGSHPPKVMGPA